MRFCCDASVLQSRPGFELWIEVLDDIGLGAGVCGSHLSYVNIVDVQRSCSWITLHLHTLDEAWRELGVCVCIYLCC